MDIRYQVVVLDAADLHAVSGFFLEEVSLTYLATALTGGTLLGIVSTLAFAIAESHFSERPQKAERA